MQHNLIDFWQTVLAELPEHNEWWYLCHHSTTFELAWNRERKALLGLAELFLSENPSDLFICDQTTAVLFERKARIGEFDRAKIRRAFILWNLNRLQTKIL